MSLEVNAPGSLSKADGKGKRSMGPRISGGCNPGAQVLGPLVHS